MKTRLWARRGALTSLLLATACGSGKSRGHGGTDDDDAGSSAGAGGKGSGGSSTADAGSGGTAPGAGGAPSSGGSQGDGGTGADATPPSFLGATGAEGLGEDRAKILWTAASDDQTPTAQIAYRVYRSATSAGQDFSRARRCGAVIGDAGAAELAEAPCYVTTPAGATSAVIVDVVPEQTFFYVARAVDASGNEDTNTTEVSIKTTDGTGPEFGGVDSATVLSAHEIEVKWGAAYDLSAPDSRLTFRVYVKTADATDLDVPTFVSPPGEHTAVIAGLLEKTHYDVRVEAVDPNGNAGQGGDFQIGVVTFEGVAPTFDGARRASAKGREILIVWPPARDNETKFLNIVYDVYSSRAVSHGQKFNLPPRATTIQGASSIKILEAEENTKYFYVVRARDVAGNQEQNSNEVQAVTEGSDTTPPNFAGASALTSTSPSTVAVTWSPANDDLTTSDKFRYDVFLSTTTPVPLTTPRASIRGGTSLTVGGLTPDTTYFTAVRATDLAGNTDETTPIAERSGKTLVKTAGDAAAPTLAGGVLATRDTTKPHELRITGLGATDTDDAGTGGSAAGQIRYQVCASPESRDCTQAFSNHVVLVTARGVATAKLQNLLPRTIYTVAVRAEDENGNVSNPPQVVQESTATSWSENVRPMLAERCYACHAYAIDTSKLTGVDSALYDAQACLVGAGKDDGFGCRIPFVAAGYPEFSALYRKVNLVNSKLPPFSPAVENRYEGLMMPLDSSGDFESDPLRDWITEGALAN